MKAMASQVSEISSTSESASNTQATGKSPSSSEEVCWTLKSQLPGKWSKGLPPEDHSWISKALFKENSPRRELVSNLQLWYHPPQPSNSNDQPPSPDHFFGHPLLVWMPYKLWNVEVCCTEGGCKGRLKRVGVDDLARSVLDVDGFYYLVTETLKCDQCEKNKKSWDQTVLSQLNLGQRSAFRVILTGRYACDIRVIRFLRERGLGNSPTRVIKQLKENHSEEWLTRVAQYTSACSLFHQSELGTGPFPKPPEYKNVPTPQWLLKVYREDILTRIDEVKASITSTFGTILKMDSTKKVVKKLTWSF